MSEWTFVNVGTDVRTAVFSPESEVGKGHAPLLAESEGRKEELSEGVGEEEGGGSVGRSEEG